MESQKGWVYFLLIMNKTFPHARGYSQTSLPQGNTLISPLMKGKASHAQTWNPSNLDTLWADEAFIPSFMEWIMINNSQRVRNYSHALLLKMLLRPGRWWQQWRSISSHKGPQPQRYILKSHKRAVTRWLEELRKPRPLSQLCLSVHLLLNSWFSSWPPKIFFFLKRESKSYH